MKIENCKAQIVGLHLISSILVLFILAATMLASPSQAYSADKSSTGKATKSSPGETAKPAAPDRSRTLGGVAPAKSDTFVTSYTNDPDTINPIIAHDSVSRDFLRWVYEPLAQQSFSDPDTFEPALAESWTFDKQNLLFTIKLRKGVKWHPMKLPGGKLLPAKDFTARDVKFTYDCILNPNINAASLRSYFEDPDAKDASQKYKIKVTVIDDYTVKIKWSKPYFLAEEFSLSGDIYMMPRHVFSVNEKGEPISFDYSSKEFADGFNNHWANRQMCGSGPLKFVQWSKDERVVLDRHDDYWGAPFYFSQVIFRSIPNANTSRQSALQYELDYSRIAEKNLFLEGKEHENVKSGKVVAEVFDYPGFRFVGYNLKRELFKDKRVRWALSHTIPVQDIIDVVFKGLARRSTGPLQVGSTGYDATIPGVPYDLERAAHLLSEAGWEDTDGSGVRSKTVGGQKILARFDLMIYADAPSFLTIAEIIKENCRKVGVDVQISASKWGLMLQKFRKKEFDACMLGWVMDWKSDLFQSWHSSQADVPESSNTISYANPEMDKLIDEMRVTLDADKQIELYHRMHRVIYDDQPYTFLFSEKFTAFRDARLQNIKFHKIRPGFDVREWSATRPRAVGN